MDNYLLLAIVVLKAICLFFCWKAITFSGKQKNSSLSKEETELLNERMNKAMEQNRLLQKELQSLQGKREN